jgi:putative oxidoreductase
MADERQAFGWMLGQIGISHTGTMLWIISVISFTGGLALLAGAFVRPLCIALAANVPAILFLIHVPSGFDFVKLTVVTVQGPQYGLPGYEVSLLYMAGLLSLHLSGAGPLSVDRVRARRRHGRRSASLPTPREAEPHQEPEFAGAGFVPPEYVLIAATPSNVQTRDVDAARLPHSTPAASDESNSAFS